MCGQIKICQNEAFLFCAISFEDCFSSSYRTSKYPVRINKFSSPDIHVNSVPTGVSNEADCRRAHLERRFIMAARGDESGVCQPKESQVTNLNLEI